MVEFVAYNNLRETYSLLIKNGVKLRCVCVCFVFKLIEQEIKFFLIIKLKGK